MFIIKISNVFAKLIILFILSKPTIMQSIKVISPNSLKDIFPGKLYII
jgi:hypothetical protein